MSHRTRKSAYEEAEDRGEVFCLDCEEVVKLGVQDNSFSHAFGTEFQYDVCCPKCGGYNWADRGPCKFAVKLPSGRYACDLKEEDICECDVKTRDDCYAWEDKNEDKNPTSKNSKK